MPREMHMGGVRNGAPQRVFIATPMGTAPCATYTFSLAQSMIALAAAGIEVDISLLVGDCHVDDARNTLVRRFLETDCTDLVFIDADVGWEPINLIKLLHYDCDVVAGIYPKKQDSEEYPIYTFPGDRVTDERGLIKVPGVPTGFMRIRRHVLESMWEDEPRKFYGSRDQELRPQDRPMAILFERTYENNKRYSGDYSWCNKFRARGGEIFIDPTMTFEHSGEKNWIGNLGKFWCAEDGLLTPTFKATVAKLLAGDDSEDAFATLYIEWGNTFSATPQLCNAVYLMAKETAGPILETGSGLTTLLMALANPHVEVHSLEHERDWLHKTRGAMEQLGIKNIKLHYAPLRDYDGFTWYEVPDDLPASFAMVLCDGPQQRFGRSGLFKLLSDRIRDAVFVSDDADHEVNIAPVREWARSMGREVSTLGTPRKFAISLPRAQQLAASSAA